MYKIGELSKLCNISVKTLRYYDSVGLLIPDEIDKFTGYRYYSAAKLSELYRIIALKELGFSLEDIKKQITAKESADIVESLEAKMRELSELIGSTEKQLKRLCSIRDDLTQGERKLYNVIIRQTDGMRLAFLRKTFETKNDALSAAEKIACELPKAILGKRKVIINYETEHRESDFDLAACVEITGSLPKGTVYGEKTVAFGGSVASLVCPADDLDGAYKEMIRHLNETNHKICGAYYEIYHDDGTVELKVPVFERGNGSIFETEDIDLPFVDDPDVCGKWEMIDIVPTREHFVYGKPKCGHRAWLDELYFIDGGQKYWALAGWTKGYLFTCGARRQLTLKNKYTIEDDGGHKLLFIEMKHWRDGGVLSEGVPEIWVYEKVGDERYASKEEIRRCDNVDYPFINDDNVLGVWKVRDFYINIDDFDHKKQNWPENDFYVQQLEFKNDGTFVQSTKEHSNQLTWTKGLLLYTKEKVACAYEIKVFDGIEYLIVQWKTGDYNFGGGRIYWYVYTR